MGALTHEGEVLQSLPANASQINFDNDGTDLSATQTENAIKEVNTKANTLQSEKADTDMVASDFSTAVSYTAGNYCIYEGKFYKFKNNHSGAWSAADVDEIKIAGELSSVKSGLTSVSSLLNFASNGKISIKNIPATGTTFSDYLADMAENETRIFTFINMTDNVDGLTQGLCIATRLGGYSPSSVQCLALNDTTIKSKTFLIS